MENSYIQKICAGAKSASPLMGNLSSAEKTEILHRISSELKDKVSEILKANALDMKNASGLSSAMQDRLFLDEKRIHAMASSIDEIADFPDPVGRIENMKIRPSGIRVGQMRVPLGVVCVIFEARPNVTTDIAALCIKSGNACILRGGKEALRSNAALHRTVAEVLASYGLPEEAVTFIDNTDHALVPVLLKQRKYIDVVIPRGGEGLVRMVTEESSIPVLKHDRGLCHIFVDESADEKMALPVVLNAKVQRPGVCNAVETLLIHRNYPFIKELLQGLLDAGVEVRGCSETVSVLPGKILPAEEEDWDREYLDLILSVKVVSGIEEAMKHIAVHTSGHSEAIITSDYVNSERFLREVDSAAVFVNASTRFHDGGELGLGAEVGISTEKLHARGAMGVEGLTTLKYVIYGHGEVR